MTTGRDPLTTRCCACGHRSDSPRDFAWYDHRGGYLCLNKSSCIARQYPLFSRAADEIERRRRLTL